MLSHKSDEEMVTNIYEKHEEIIKQNLIKLFQKKDLNK